METRPIVISGSRHFTGVQHKLALWQVLRVLPFRASLVVTGGAAGIDAHGAAFARWAGVPHETIHADWDRHGRMAGPLRNQEMALRVAPDGAVILVWDGRSRGSRSMLGEARRHRLLVYQRVIDEPADALRR